MKTNRIYSIFSKGQPYGNRQYGRFVQETAFAYENDEGRPMLDALTPYNDELLRAAYAEHLTQFLIKSQFGERALELDPDNSYEKGRPQFPQPGSSVREEIVVDPFDVTVLADAEVLREKQGSGIIELPCVVDTGAQTLAHRDDVFSYTVSNGLSSKIGIIPGIDIKMRSDFANPEYVFTIRQVLPAAVDWKELWARVWRVPPKWSDSSLEVIWEQDPRWDQKLAAYMMSAVELMNRA